MGKKFKLKLKMKASEILKLNSDFLLPPPAPCLSGRIGNPYGLCNLKPVDVTVCAVAVSFLSPLLCSALTVCQAHHPEPAALPEQQQQLPFFPCLCVPCSLPSSAQLCPPQAAASDSAPPNETRCPSCPNASRCTCLLTLGAAGRHLGRSPPLQMSLGFPLCC